MPGVKQNFFHQWDTDNYSASPASDKNMFARSSLHSNGYMDGQHQAHPQEVGAGVGSDEVPTYLIEHLATFTVSKETSIMYPADGMRRLLQLEKSNGIWSQKMQMQLDRNWVLIMDYETGVIMERFPVDLIQEPTAFTSHDPMEIYNNILVFIVGDDRQDRQDHGMSRSEMHIFQCQSISAQELVEDLKLLQAGKVPPNRRTELIPPPPATPPPEPPGELGVNVRSQVSVFNASANRESAGPHGDIGPGMFPGRDGISFNDETCSTSSEKYERDVTVLNHCFDDIEKFIARLQHAAAASRELERRRRNRKSKKKDFGDGMLTMRAKPPPEVEFIDIFQKFKLSFNLLAKLKAHIHDPNAPELVHFLFTPLALIVDASHDTHYGPNLPAKVLSPLLTREAVNLLINCVTSKETELWHSLGDAWLIPRDQWKGYVAPYHPVFLDGWSPESPFMDERENPALISDYTRHGDSSRAAPHDEHDGEHESHYSIDYFDYDRQESMPSGQNQSAFDNSNFGVHSENEDRDHSPSPGALDREYMSGAGLVVPPATGRDAGAHSDISADSIEHGIGDDQQRFERSQARWLEELHARGARIVQVTYPRTANNDKELTVVRGEYLEVVDDSRKWWKACNSRGKTAHVPHTIVTPYQYPGSGDPGDMFSNPLYAPPRGYDRQYAKQDSPRGERDIASSVESRPTRSPPIPPPAPADWVRKERLGKKEGNGDVDTTTDEDSNSISSGIFTDPQNTDPVSYPPTPPPMPAPPIPATDMPITRSSYLKRGQSSHDLMQEELKAVLTMFRDKQPSLGILKTPEVYINQNSSPDEVRQWLQDKCFSERVCNQLSGMNGNELFVLSKKQLEHYFGSLEGRRLDSQITIQRNISEYKTARSSELRAILARARLKAEESSKVE